MVQMRRLLGQLSRLEGQIGELTRRVDELGRHQRDMLGASPTVPGHGASDRPRWNLAPIAELQDSVHLIARRNEVRGRRMRVLFLVHQIATWDSCHDVFQAMLASEDFEPIVASIPHHFRGDPVPVGEQEVSDALDARGVEHLRFSTVDDQTLRLIKYLAPDLIFRQSQWDADIPAPLGVEHLTFAQLCFVPYETMNIVKNVPSPDGRDLTYDTDLHRAAAAVFCTNERVRALATAASAGPGEQFRVVGHPKADRLRAVDPVWPIEGRPDARRILWSAHHTIGEGWTDFGLFGVVRDEMLAWARETPDIDFVFMPHPALIPFASSPNSPTTADQMQAWLHAWNALPNTAVLRDADYMPALAASDLMITDGLSMLVEYQVLTKPLIFLERPGHRPFNDIGELLSEGFHTVHNVSSARRKAAELLSAPDPLAERQQQIVAELFGTEPAPAAERILTELRALVGARPAGKV
jgi:hypothetical protein